VSHVRERALCFSYREERVMGGAWTDPWNRDAHECHCECKDEEHDWVTSNDDYDFVDLHGW
jgi:hypothetical protein